jgi:hypothetical protein
MRKRLFESNEPKGTYQLWFKDGENFQHVANVEAGNYMAAVALPLFEAEELCRKRVTWLVNVSRSIGFGDKIVDPNGEAFEVYRPRFGGISLISASHPGEEVGRELQEQGRGI